MLTFYIVGCVLAVILCTIETILNAKRRLVPITIGDILVTLFTGLFSWISVLVFMMYFILTTSFKIGEKLVHVVSFYSKKIIWSPK